VDARPDSRAGPGRRGIVLPLALLVLVAVALLAALLFDAGVQEVRAARGGVAAARAMAALERALADLMTAPLDSAVLAPTPGTVTRTVNVGPGDSADVVVQAIGRGTVRVVIRAGAREARARAAEGVVAFLRVVADSSEGVPVLRLRPLPGWWRAPLP